MKKILKNKVVIIGVGNILRGDDGLGPKFIELLKDFASDKFIPIDAGEVPENYTGKILKLSPDVVLFVDAVEIGESPGTVKIIPPSILKEDTLSTHKLPLGFVMKYLENEGIKSFLIGIQPVQTEFNTDLSISIKSLLIDLKEVFEKALSSG